MKWSEFDAAIYRWETENPTKRITRIYFSGDDAPAHYSGAYSECDLSHGKPSVMLSSGEIIEI